MFSGTGKLGRGRSRLGDFSARMQVPTISYISPTPTLVTLTQTIVIPPVKTGHRHILFSANSRIERLASAKSWSFHLSIRFSTGHVQSVRDEFDMEIPPEQWQNRVVSVCVARDAVVERIEIGVGLETYRGAVYWDDLAVVMI
jgi:hypothetical protein